MARPESAPPVDAVRARLIATEFERARAAPAPAPGPAIAPRATADRPADRTALRLEQAMVERRSGRLERELADARGELAAARRELERQRLLCERAYNAIDHVRGELARLGAAAPALGEPTEWAARAPVAPEPVQAEKLTAALARLRETRPAAPEEPMPALPEPPATPATPAPTADPARPAKPWLGKTFRRLAARDASSAGRLLLALLPAQRAADLHPVAYDLVLGDLATVGVTVSSASAHVDLGDARRPLSEIDFQVIGDLASIARLLAAGPVRRRLGRLALPTRWRGFGVTAADSERSST